MNRPDNQPQCNGDSLSRWVSEHGSALRGFLRGAVRNADLANDLLQDVFCRAWSARKSYIDMGNERAYLLRIADRLVCDYYRRNRIENEYVQRQAARLSPGDPDLGPFELTVRSETEQQLAIAIQKLTPIQRRILLLRYYGDLSFQEIAELTAIPLNTALSHCRRGLLALRQLLKEESL